MTKGTDTKSPSRDNELKKKNFSLPYASLQTIANLRSSTDCSTDTEVVKRALRLYEEVIAIGGGRCYLKTSDGVQLAIKP